MCGVIVIKLSKVLPIGLLFVTNIDVVIPPFEEDFGIEGSIFTNSS